MKYYKIKEIKVGSDYQGRPCLNIYSIEDIETKEKLANYDALTLLEGAKLQSTKEQSLKQKIKHRDSMKKFLNLL